MNHVVIWDPENEYWEGAIVPQEIAAALEQRGVATLPCEPSLFTQAGFCGFAKRSWGAGWPLDGDVPMATCPMSIFYPGEPFRRLVWKARLVGTVGQGIPLRLAAGEARGNVIRPVLHDVAGKSNAVDVAKLGDADAEGGWTVGGETHLSVSGPSSFALCLYGSAPGVRVAWLAATLIP